MEASVKVPSDDPGFFVLEIHCFACSALVSSQNSFVGTLAVPLWASRKWSATPGKPVLRPAARSLPGRGWRADPLPAIATPS